MRPILVSPLFWLASAGFALALGFGFGCSSSSAGGGTTAGEGGPSPDTGGGSPDTGGAADGGAHDAPAADALYGACAVNAGFGWPCAAAATGPDAVNCTNPAFPVCFVGGQGAWCTKTCANPSECTSDAGCTPTACNSKGYCK